MFDEDSGASRCGLLVAGFRPFGVGLRVSVGWVVCSRGFDFSGADLGL